MPRTSAPHEATKGTRWCARHNGGKGMFLLAGAFPPNYSYCLECKREYQRKWDSTVRVRPAKAVVPRARLSAAKSAIIIHLPNDEKGRNLTRMVMERYPEGNSYL